MRYELTLLSRVSFRDREIAGPRLVGLLALLAADLRTGCGTSRLIEELWPDQRPANPGKALQILVSRARGRLGAEVVESTATGYRLSLREDQVDAAAVLTAAAASARSARSGDHAAALERAESALAAWDGPPAAAAEPTDPLTALRAERAATYWSLARCRALALSRLGRHAEALESLVELVDRRPRDEELLLELVRSEAAEMGPAVALTRYESYRQALRDELGTDPGPDLRTAYHELLEAGAPAAWHGVAYEPNELLGRDADIAAVAGLLRTSRVVSIVGVGGLGKTRLAHAVSRRADQRRVYVVALAGVARPDDVAGEVATALGVGEAPPTTVPHRPAPTDVRAGIVDALGATPTLLVLDNCEHVLDGVADLVGTLVALCRDLRVLTTSRSPLGLTSESVHRLPELTAPISVRLFEQRATAARPGVELPDDVVAKLCERLDGLPLAVELAAARVRVLSVAEIARNLDDRFALLQGGPRDAPERHHTLHAVVDWSWNLLDPTDQAAMRALSIFPDGFTVEAARRLLGDVEPAAALSTLEHLVDQSLLQLTESSSQARFRMLETVREFSVARRDETGETDRTTDRFLAWARDFGVDHHDAVFGPDAFAAAERIRAEQDNLGLALRTGLVRDDDAAVAVTAALAGLWSVDANYPRMVALIEDTGWILSHYRPGPDLVDVARSAATVCAMNAFMIQGPRATRALAAVRRLPEPDPTTLVGAIAILLRLAAVDDRSRLLALCDSDSTPLLAGVANCAVSYIWESEGDTDAALDAARRMLTAIEGQPSPWASILAHLRISELCLHVERGAEAREHLRVALDTLEASGPWSDVLQIRWALALAALQVDEIDEAEQWLALAAKHGGTDAPGMVTFDLGIRAEIQLARGRVEAGLRLWRRAVDELAKTASPMGPTDAADGDPWSSWAVGMRAVAVVAHGRHGRIDLVEDVVDDLTGALAEMLTDPVHFTPSVVIPICGAGLLALAVVDLDRGRRVGDGRVVASGVRLVALAERFRFLREFQPTMSRARAREAAESADGPTYADAVSTYAGLSTAELPVAALAVLRDRASSPAPG